MPLRALPEILVTLPRPGELLVSNPFVRTHAVADAAFVELLSHLREPREPEELASRFGDRPLRAVDASRSQFADGLLGDPTGLAREVTLDDAPELDLDAALALARRLRFAVEDEAAYAASLAPREHVLDRKHHGDVHQRVGEHVLLGLRRPSVDEWWADQKFTPDRRGPRDGPYDDVQWRFMTGYYDEARLRGRRVLDFGCGPGLFARLFARAGAEVLGLDTNDDHLETARRLADEAGLGDRVAFERLRLPAEDHVAGLERGAYDLIFLSDVLMFYFHPYGTSEPLDPVALLRGLAPLLAPGGTIAVLEPQGTFWQQPWLGDEGRPFTVLTEHRRRRSRVTPTLEELSRAAEAAGLAISRVREPVPPDDVPSSRSVEFARAFPLWWFFELRPLAA